MKKLLTALLAAALAAEAVCLPASATEYEFEGVVNGAITEYRYDPVCALGTDASAYAPGDVNMDGAVNAKDANAALVEFALNDVIAVGHILNEDQRRLADVHADGKVDSKDAGLILSYYLCQVVEVDEIDQLSLAEFSVFWEDKTIDKSDIRAALAEAVKNRKQP